MIVSIHARHATGDRPAISPCALIMFQFTPVMRRATPKIHHRNKTNLFQFTPVMRRATGNLMRLLRIVFVSIHARHATGDSVVILAVKF